MSPSSTRWLTCLVLCLAVTSARAQHKGGGGQAPRQAPPMTNDEKERAATAAEWKDMIERARANLPQHPPVPVFKFPSKNTSALANLRYAENPRGDLEKYLTKLWSDAPDLSARRNALDTLWQEAQKPAWARASIEDYFRRKSGGQPLQAPPPEPAAVVAASPAPKTEH